MDQANNLLYGRRRSSFNGGDYERRSPIERGQAIFEMFDYRGGEGIIFAAADLLHVIDDERPLSTLEAELILSRASKLAAEYSRDSYGATALDRIDIEGEGREASLNRGRRYLATMSRGRYAAGGEIDQDVCEALSYLMLAGEDIGRRRIIDLTLDRYIADKQTWKEIDASN